VISFEFDRQVRAAAFAYLARATENGELPATWSQLQTFFFNGERIPLASQQGIFKPAALQLPISIRTTPPETDGSRPYADEISHDGYLIYRYRGTDPNHRDNRALRAVMENSVTLVYLEGVGPGLYNVSAAGIIEDHPEVLAFNVALFPIDATASGAPYELAELATSGTRRHYLALVRRRADQAAFRSAVLTAYHNRCCVCSLGHSDLLDAAHIIPDSAGGPSIVPNGMSMCKIHHAAFDHDIMGIRPDYVAEVRTDVLAEIDGPMLRHGIQAIHGRRIRVPRPDRHRPDPSGLEVRYERFRAAS
jgi:putative restriction endonuclease